MNMVRTQLYLPDETYKKVKDLAAAKNMTFAAYVRDCIDEKAAVEAGEDDVYKKNPFLKHRFFGGSPDSSNNKKIDEFLYGY